MLLTLLLISSMAFFTGIGCSLYWSKRIDGIADNWRGALILLLIWGGAAMTSLLLITQVVVMVL